MTLIRDDHYSTMHAHPRHLIIRFQDRTLELGLPYPKDALEVDDFHLGTLTIAMTRARGKHYSFPGDPQLVMNLAQEAIEIDISQPFPAEPPTLAHGGEYVPGPPVYQLDYEQLQQLRIINSRLFGVGTVPTLDQCRELANRMFTLLGQIAAQ